MGLPVKGEKEEGRYLCQIASGSHERVTHYRKGSADEEDHG
jgi:hypothetical protein